MLTLLIVLSIVALIGMFSLNTVALALRKGKKEEKKRITVASQNFFRLLTALLFGMTLIGWHESGPLTFLFTLIALLILFFIGEVFPRMIGKTYPESVFVKVLTPLAFVCNFIKVGPRYEPQETVGIEKAAEPADLEPQEKKIFESVVSFRDRIAREVMVPRVDIFFLTAATSIREATEQIQKENYSRVPVYKQSVDEIAGILLWRDLLVKYLEYVEKKEEKILEAPIETILRPALYTPETKKISRLLQELRKKQMHMAIVVDEYGGTQGIVTIEDILEEIVGEIADEFDEEPPLFKQLPEGGWIVDARMSIYDIEDQLEVKIPQQGDYDTLGGYLFHETGTIPPKGFTIRHDDFTLKVLSSTDRQVSKVELKKNEPAK